MQAGTPCLCGTELKRLLSWFGIKEEEGCGCGDRARQMDEMGCDAVESLSPLVIQWMREEATRRGIPFFEPAARAALALAISNARRASRAEQ